MVQRQEAEKLIKIIRPYPVKYLYKYRSMESKGLEDVFFRRKIYLTDCTKFNDPFECRPMLTFHKSSLKREIFLKELAKDRFPTAGKRTLKRLIAAKKPLLTDQDTLRKVYNGFISTIGIYCVSEKNNDLLMWSHYSDSHRGLCLEFEASTEETLFWEAFKVIYQEDYPTVNIMDIGKAEEFRKALLTKSTHWKYEEEQRILKTKQEGGPGHYQFFPELLTGVILGSLMSDRNKEIVMSWIQGYPTRIALYQAKLNDRRYQLDIVKIS